MAERTKKRQGKAAVVDDPLAEIEPHTELFAKLLEYRAQMIAAGVPLLPDEELEREKAERRGGYYVGARDE